MRWMKSVAGDGDHVKLGGSRGAHRKEVHRPAEERKQGCLVFTTRLRRGHRTSHLPHPLQEAHQHERGWQRVRERFLICPDGERGIVLSMPQGSALSSVRPPANTLHRRLLFWLRLVWRAVLSTSSIAITHGRCLAVDRSTWRASPSHPSMTLLRHMCVMRQRSGLRIGGRDICEPPDTVFV